MLSGFACPTCMAAGVKSNLIQSSGKYGLYCEKDSNHIFQDTEAFLASNPVKLDIPKAAPKIQPGVEPFIVKIPTGLIEMLGKRFGQKLDVSVGVLLGVMTDPEAFVVVGEDVKRLRELLSAKIASADALVGSVYNLWTERNQYKNQVEQKTSSVGSSSEQLPEMNGDFVQSTIRINTDAFLTIKEKAKFNNMTFSQYIQEIVMMGVKNSWI